MRINGNKTLKIYKHNCGHSYGRGHGCGRYGNAALVSESLMHDPRPYADWLPEFYIEDIGRILRNTSYLLRANSHPFIEKAKGVFWRP